MAHEAAKIEPQSSFLFVMLEDILFRVLCFVFGVRLKLAINRGGLFRISSKCTGQLSKFK